MNENRVNDRDEPAICRIRRVVVLLRILWIHDRAAYRFLTTDGWDEVTNCIFDDADGARN